MQCADITFSANALPVSNDVCFNSTGVGSAPFTYDTDTSKAVNSTCESASASPTTASKGAASNLKVSIAGVGAVGLVMAAMMM